MADPRKESHTICLECGKMHGEEGGVVYHFSQLRYVEPGFWNPDIKEAHWVCPHGHKVEPPKMTNKPAAPPAASS